MSRGQEGASGVNLQEEGRRLLANLYGALRAIRFYPLENEAVEKALEDLHQTVARLLVREGGVEFRILGDFFFLNETRLRLDLRNFSTFGAFGRILREHGVGELRIDPRLEVGDWAPFLSLLLRPPDATDPFRGFLGRFRQAGIQRIHVEPEKDAARLDMDQEAMAGAKRTYAYAVQITREVLTDLREGRGVNVRKVKRVIQSVVDQILSDEGSLVAMTTLRDLDDHIFTHSVNVCIFSIAIGKRLGLGKLQLYELGLGALFHDVGKMRATEEALKGEDTLDEDELRALRKHPSAGLLALFGLHGFAEVPYGQMLIAYEHHMKMDLSGYPPSRRERAQGLFPQIVAVADSFDASISPRSYRYRSLSPAEVLKEMREDPESGYDPVLVKALMIAVGVYPVGTLLVLDTQEVAMVTRTNPDADRPHQPEVKVLSDAGGVPLAEPTTVHLDETDGETGRPLRAVKRSADPERYGIRAADFTT